MGDETTTGPVVRPFAQFLQQQARGHSHHELSEGLHELVRRCQDTGKKGSITYVVTVNPKSAESGVMVVSDEIKLKLPEHDRDSSIFWADADGNLTRSNPDQMSLRLQAVDGGDVVDVDVTTGEIRKGGQR